MLTVTREAREFRFSWLRKKKTDIKMLKNKNFGRQISATVSMKLTHNKDRFKLQIFYKKKLLKKKKPKH